MGIFEISWSSRVKCLLSWLVYFGCYHYWYVYGLVYWSTFRQIFKSFTVYFSAQHLPDSRFRPIFLWNLPYIHSYQVKEKRFKKIAWIWSHHLHLHWKFKWKVCLRCKCQTLLWVVIKLLKFVDITQQCFALLSEVIFPAHYLNFHWRWRWWDQIQATF